MSEDLSFLRPMYMHSDSVSLNCHISVTRHLSYYVSVYRWVQAGVWTQRTQEMYIRWGLVALVSMDILFFFSLAFIRQNYYNVFYVSHSISLVVLLVAVRPLASSQFAKADTNPRPACTSHSPSRTSPSPRASTAPTTSSASSNRAHPRRTSSRSPSSVRRSCACPR